MINCKVIFTSGYEETDDSQTELKGHRSDVLFVDENSLSYQINFIDLNRLKIDFDYRLLNNKKYFSDVGLVIIEKVNKNNIIDALVGLKNDNFFHTQKSIDIAFSKDWYVEFI